MVHKPMSGHGFNTLALHAGRDPNTDASATPIYATAAYRFQDTAHAADLFALRAEGHVYSRISNPTNSVLEECVASLEGGVGALALASGASAIFMTILALCEQNSTIVSSRAIYGGTYSQLETTQKRLGFPVNFVDINNLDEVRQAVDSQTRLIFAEIPSNPSCVVPDLEGLAAIAHENQIPLVVDSTIATPYLCRPFEYGADIVVHSTTKFLSGHGVTLGGMVVDGGKFNWDNGKFPGISDPSPAYNQELSFHKNFGERAFIVRLRAEILRDIGPVASPFNSFLTLLGVETLALRMQRHVENARQVAESLVKHPKVGWVNYPIFENNPSTANARKYLPKGPGAVFTFGLKDGYDGCVRLIERIKLAIHLANIGDIRTLLVHPASTTHSELSEEAQAAVGISPGLMRISVGLEDARDIIADLEDGLG